MSFRALLVSKDNQAAEVLTPVLSSFGLSPECCGYSDAVCLVAEQKFQAVLVDFDDPHSAALVLQSLASTLFQTNSVTVALLADKKKVRNVFGAGANFVLYKPISEDQAAMTLRAATALIKRERRTAFRVPIQVAVQLQLAGSEQGASSMDGILLDLSETGMDVLSAQPLYPSARLTAAFLLPDAPSEFQIPGEVAWANPNGESGVRFSDVPESVLAALRAWFSENARPAQPTEPQAISDCRLTDLSLGGCYVETASPFPEQTRVLMTLSAEGIEFNAQGLVLVMHPSHGMGIEFAARTAEDRQQTLNFLNFLTSRPGVQPELRVAPQSLNLQEPAQPDEFSAEFDDPLLDLLRNHESFSEDMFLQALRSQRTGDFVES